MRCAFCHIRRFSASSPARAGASPGAFAFRRACGIIPRHEQRPRPLRPVPDGIRPHRQHPRRRLQLALRPPRRRQVPPAHRGHRPRALHQGGDRQGPRRDGLARPRLRRARRLPDAQRRRPPRRGGAAALLRRRLQGRQGVGRPRHGRKEVRRGRPLPHAEGGRHRIHGPREGPHEEEGRGHAGLRDRPLRRLAGLPHRQRRGRHQAGRHPHHPRRRPRREHLQAHPDLQTSSAATTTSRTPSSTSRSSRPSARPSPSTRTCR